MTGSIPEYQKQIKSKTSTDFRVNGFSFWYSFPLWLEKVKEAKPEET